MNDGAIDWTIVGIDCASQDQHIGLARGVLSGAALRLCEARVGGRIVGTLSEWLKAPRVLLAIDAPLGWPRPLADALRTHRAGEPIIGESTWIVRRETDRVVARSLRKTPLDVAADRIAYAGLRALRLLGELRAATGLALPLLTSPGHESGAIEVYPAATLLARSIDTSDYKNKTAAARSRAQTARERLLGHLASELDIDPGTSEQVRTARREDMFDACVCVLAGADFLHGRCDPPSTEQRELAAQEGWIWFRQPTKQVGERGGRAGS